VLPHCVAEARKNSIRKLKLPHRLFTGDLTKTLPKIAAKLSFCKFASQTCLFTVLPHSVAEARKNSIRKLKLPHRLFTGEKNVFQKFKDSIT
jgi:hypothetical protein